MTAYALDDGLRDAVAATLRDAEADPAFAAEAILLPGETLLADSMAVIDPDAIHAVREATKAALGQALRPAFTAALTGFAATDPADLSGAAIGSRAIKNVALGYLTAAGDTGFAAAQFAAAANMTDTLAALVCLAETAGTTRDDAFASFYAKWHHNPLVLDKWFAVQARAGAPDTLARVQSLLRHPDFDIRNPNRLRALIGAFAGNTATFHDKSGAGYTLLADTIIAVDAINPMIAARLCAGLGTWRRYDTGRQTLMRAALERILGTAPLSPNTFEMVSKALA